MRKSPILFLISVALLFFSLRFLDVLFISGMGINTLLVDFIHFTAYLACVGFAVIIFLQYRKKTKNLSEQDAFFSKNEIKAFHMGVFPVLFTVTAILIGASSVSIGYRVIIGISTFNQPIFMSIYASVIELVLDLISAISGLVAMFWLILVSLWFLRGKGELAVNSYFSLSIVLWFYSRALSGFLGKSINQHQSAEIIALFSLVSLALGFAKFSRFLAFNFSVRDYAALISTSVFCLVWVVGLAGPELAFTLSQIFVLDSALIVSDVLSAITLFLFSANIVVVEKSLKKQDIKTKGRQK